MERQSDSPLAILERAPSFTGAKVDEIFGDLPERATKLLGYSALQNKNDTALREVLEKCGVRPFTMASITNYKKGVMTKSQRRAEFFIMTCVYGMISFFVLLLGTVVTSLFVKSLGHNHLLTAWLVGCGVFLVGFLILGLVSESIFSRVVWQNTPLKGYERPVPEYALLLATEIKEHLPEVDFSVHELLVRAVTFDPFLVVHFGNEEYYIAVWDEPDFKAERKV